MIKEFKTTFRYSLIIISIIAAVFLFLDFRVSLGMFLGLLSFYLYLNIMTFNMTSLLNGRKASKGILVLVHILDLLILILPLLLASLLPNLFNIFGVFTGLMINRILLFGLYGRKGKMEEKE